MFKKYKTGILEFKKDIEKWYTQYSRINRVEVVGDKLVLQVRTCDEKLKKFALLVYRTDTFKHLDTILVDDLLVASRGEKLYFWQGGDPGLDENTEQAFIKIYKFKDACDSKKK